MYRLLRTGLIVLAASALVPAGSLRAAQAAPGPSSMDRQVSDALKDVHNRGADLFNNGDRVGCYRVFQGLLWTVRPLLAGHPDIQKEIDDGLANAERISDVNRRALALHEVIESVRRKLTPAPKPEEKKPEEKIEKKPEKPPEAKPKTTDTLWDRLGGQEKVRKVVDDFVANAAADPQVNFDRNGKYKFSAKQVDDLKTKLVEFVSQATGGPLKYTGKSMKDVHKGMGITDAEFDAIKRHLKYALEKNGAQPADVTTVLDAVEGTRKDMVENKPAEKKPAEKKPAEKKPVEKKPENKPEEKKPPGKDT